MTDTHPPAARASTLETYRDDGPVAAALGRLAGRSWLGAPGRGRDRLVVTLLAAAPVSVSVVAGMADGSEALDAGGPHRWWTGLALAWFVLLAGSAATRGSASAGAHPGLAWWLPTVLRAVEYGFLIAVAVPAGGSAPAAAFLLVAVLAFHHYDTVYRLGLQRRPPAAWVSAAGGGWELRLAVAYGAGLAGAVTEVYLAAAVTLGALFVTESVLSWVRFTAPLGATAAPTHLDEGEIR